jgi:hypothetical protein
MIAKLGRTRPNAIQYDADFGLTIENHSLCFGALRVTENSLGPA